MMEYVNIYLLTFTDSQFRSWAVIYSYFGLLFFLKWVMTSRITENDLCWEWE